MSDLVQQTRGRQQAQRPITEVLQGQAPGLSLALADRIGVDRFIRAAVTAFRTTPKLAKCSQESILGGLFVAAQLGLEVGGPRGLVYLVPYGKEAQLVVGYKGWVDLFYRAGAKSVDWFLVREEDQFRIGSNSQVGRFYEWTPRDLDDSRQWTGGVAQVQTANGGLVWEYMTQRQVLMRRPTYWEGTPWKTWPEQMALKTVLKQLAKRVQNSTEVALAVASDETVQRRLPGLPEHLVEHVPVEGGQGVEQEPDATYVSFGEPAGVVTDTSIEEPPMALVPDEQDDYEARAAAEHAAWVDQQGAGQ